jgi:hypothetical protein
MALDELRATLGELQADPDQPRAWRVLEQAVGDPAGGRAAQGAASLRLLTLARQEHTKRREWDAVARLLALEARVSAAPEQRLELLRLQAQVLQQDLLEEAAACRVFESIVGLDPGDREAAAALEESQTRRVGWRQAADAYVLEAYNARDAEYGSSMWMRAAEVELRFAGDGLDRQRVLERLTQALATHFLNERAAELVVLLHRRAGNHSAVVEVLELLLDGSATSAARVAAGLRAARVCRYRLSDDARAARFYRKILGLVPDHAEALAFLSDEYARQERWDDLILVYKASLPAHERPSRERLADLLQVGKLLWKKRRDLASAEPWFARVHELDPINPSMLGFYREFYASDDQAPHLIKILRAAQRALPSGRGKQVITAEIGRLAKVGKDTRRAIEQYRQLLHREPENAAAFSALGELYRETHDYTALIELIRQWLERLRPEQTEERLRLLREVAALYRSELASDTALVSVLNQITQLDPQDIAAARELVALYEKLGRWRDLLVAQQRLADLSTDTGEKRELWRAAGRRWLDQFANLQNAMRAFEALLEVSPGDLEARGRLRELYKKRRAWPALYKLYETVLPATSGAERQDLLWEMAHLSSERLGRGKDAIGVYRQILEGEPHHADALAALEKQAERSKDWAALAEALERRAEQTEGTHQKIAVLVRLGDVYQQQLGDSAAVARTFSRVLELAPSHDRALRVLSEGYLEAGNYDRLQQLYASRNDWQGLVKLLGSAADRVEDWRVKIELNYRAARVYEEVLFRPERAAHCYERILVIDRTDPHAAHALIRIYEKEEDWARLPVLYELCLASEVDPVARQALYEKLERTERYASPGYARQAAEALEASLQGATNPSERRTILRRLAGLYECNLESHGAAFDVVLRALREFTEDLALWDHAEQLAVISGRVVELVHAMRDVLRTDLTNDVEVELSDRVAHLYEDVLGDPIGAVPYLERLLLRNPADLTPFARIKSILTSSERWSELLDHYDRTTARIQDVATRLDLLIEAALVCEEVVEDDKRAVGYYERVLAIEPSHDVALRSLDRLYLRLGRYREWITIVERRLLAMEGDEALDTGLRLANVYLFQLYEAESARQYVARALAARPDDPAARQLRDVLSQLNDSPPEAARTPESTDDVPQAPHPDTGAQHTAQSSEPELAEPVPPESSEPPLAVPALPEPTESEAAQPGLSQASELQLIRQPLPPPLPAALSGPPAMLTSALLVEVPPARPRRAEIYAPRGLGRTVDHLPMPLVLGGGISFGSLAILVPYYAAGSGLAVATGTVALLLAALVSWRGRPVVKPTRRPRAPGAGSGLRVL